MQSHSSETYNFTKVHAHKKLYPLLRNSIYTKLFPKGSLLQLGGARYRYCCCLRFACKFFLVSVQIIFLYFRFSFAFSLPRRAHLAISHEKPHLMLFPAFCKTLKRARLLMCICVCVQYYEHSFFEKKWKHKRSSRYSCCVRMWDTTDARGNNGMEN